MIVNLKNWRDIKTIEARENHTNAVWEKLALAVEQAIEWRDLDSLNAILPIIAELRPLAEISLPESPSVPPNDKAFG